MSNVFEKQNKMNKYLKSTKKEKITLREAKNIASNVVKIMQNNKIKAQHKTMISSCQTKSGRKSKLFFFVITNYCYS